MTEIVTADNLDSLVYESRSGVQYELCDGCVRTMKRPTIGLDRLYSDVLARENLAQVDTSADDYWVNTRLKVISHITEGDDIPEDTDSVYTEVMNRVISDFLRMRFLSPKKPSASPVTTNEIPQ